MDSFLLQRTRGRSLLSELRSKKFTQDDFLTTYPSRNPGEDATPADITKHLMVENTSLLFLDQQGAFVHEQFFSSLSAISITQIPFKKIHLIGSRKKEIPWKTLVQFLIEADIICTYIHMESSMTITLTSKTRAEVKGTHTYFTNEENEESFSFVIEIDHEQNIYCLDNP